MGKSFGEIYGRKVEEVIPDPAARAELAKHMEGVMTGRSYTTHEQIFIETVFEDILRTFQRDPLSHRGIHLASITFLMGTRNAHLVFVYQNGAGMKCESEILMRAVNGEMNRQGILATAELIPDPGMEEGTWLVVITPKL